MSPSKRDQLIFSVEGIIKQEKDLELARKTIKNLQSHLGTVILGEDSDSYSEEEKDVLVQAEVEQEDSFFAHQHIFKTNVII